MKPSPLIVLIVLVRASFACAAEPADVVVYGGTPAGVAAAVAAADAGRTVLLIEPTDRIGGMLTCGLSNSDFRSFESLSGFFLDFAQRVESHYREKYGDDSDQVRDCFRGTHGEPSVNLLVLHAMLVERPSIRVIYEHSLSSLELSEFRQGRRQIVAAQFEPALRVTAKMFIDATYEGDLLAAAGENYHVGRESRSQYGEPMAGNHQGEADGQVQGYNFRFVMTEVQGNQRLPSAPIGYDRKNFIGVLPHFATGKLQKVFSSGRDGIYRAHLPLLPNGKADVNDTPHAPVRLSMPDINDGYPEGDAKTRAAIVRQHLYYNLGLLYFLQNDEEVPPAIRDDARRWGFCKDEFAATDGLPPQLYIREARRLVGQHVFTARDTEQVAGGARCRLHPESIACGDYVHNCHGTGRVGKRFDGKHEGEFYQQVPPYQIPYGVIVPQKTENLLVPVACSASHFGFGALRLEPIWSSLGQAAGIATSQAIALDKPVQKLDIPQLQARLHRARSATLYVSDVSPDSPDFAAVQWFGLRGGLHGIAESQKTPKPLVGQYTEAHPGHEANLDSPIDQKLREHWQSITPLADPEKSKTRRDWITAAYRNRAKY
jgi:hypothetical protein